MKLRRGLAAVAVLSVVALAGAAGATGQQQPNPESPRYKGVVAITEFLGTEGDEAPLEFLEKHIAVDWREELGDEHLLQMLHGLRDEYGGLATTGARPRGPLSATILFDGGKQLVFDLDESDPARFAMFGDGS